jgi:hypothetical protein
VKSKNLIIGEIGLKNAPKSCKDMGITSEKEVVFEGWFSILAFEWN